jgi:hypothetical protein
MKSSLHSLTPFLPLFCSCQFRRLDSLQFLCSQDDIPAGWRPETRLFTSLYAAEHFFKITSHRPRRKQSLLFTNPLRSNGCPIMAHVGSRVNMFTESLPSNGFIRHNILCRVTYFHNVQWGTVRCIICLLSVFRLWIKLLYPKLYIFETSLIIHSYRIQNWMVFNVASVSLLRNPSMFRFPRRSVKSMASLMTQLHKKLLSTVHWFWKITQGEGCGANGPPCDWTIRFHIYLSICCYINYLNAWAPCIVAL